jgi:hypothetical protein
MESKCGIGPMEAVVPLTTTCTCPWTCWTTLTRLSGRVWLLQVDAVERHSERNEWLEDLIKGRPIYLTLGLDSAMETTAYTESEETKTPITTTFDDADSPLVGLKKYQVSPGTELKDADISFPDGGLRAWLVVAGVRLLLICTGSVTRSSFRHFALSCQVLGTWILGV